MHGFVLIGCLPGYPCVCRCVFYCVCVNCPLHTQVSLRTRPLQMPESPSFRPSGSPAMCTSSSKPFSRPFSPRPPLLLCGCWLHRPAAIAGQLRVGAIAETLPATAELTEACLSPATGRSALTPMASSSPPHSAVETRLAMPVPWRCSPPLHGSLSCRFCSSSESPGS